MSTDNRITGKLNVTLDLDHERCGDHPVRVVEELLEELTADLGGFMRTASGRLVVSWDAAYVRDENGEADIEAPLCGGSVAVTVNHGKVVSVDPVASR